MRRLLVLVILLVLVSAGCTKGSSDPGLEPDPASSPATEITLVSLGIDWPDSADGWGTPPEAPPGFDGELIDDMAASLVAWAKVAATDEDTWHSKNPVDDVAAELPAGLGATLRKQMKDAVSPGLGVANVFADDVNVVDAPKVTVAWKISTPKDDAGKRFALLQLQTRTAYEVRIDDGPKRVIGVLRVHGLSAYRDSTDDFGVTGGWQEFGAGDCALATDDALLPDSDPAGARKDLSTFVRVGDGTKLEMPPLPTEEQVDSEYLKRCREGAV